LYYLWLTSNNHPPVPRWGPALSPPPLSKHWPQSSPRCKTRAFPPHGPIILEFFLRCPPWTLIPLRGTPPGISAVAAWLVLIPAPPFQGQGKLNLPPLVPPFSLDWCDLFFTSPHPTSPPPQLPPFSPPLHSVHSL